MPSSLTSEQRDRLRVDLAATAAHLDATMALDVTTTRPGQATPVPVLYTLVAPDGADESVWLKTEPVDPAVWRAAGDLATALTAFSFGLTHANTNIDSGAVGSGVYGYALAYRSHIIGTGEPAGTAHVILAVGRDGEAFLAGAGSPGPHCRMIAQALEQMVLAAQPRAAGAHLPPSAGADRQGP